MNRKWPDPTSDEQRPLEHEVVFEEPPEIEIPAGLEIEEVVPEPDLAGPAGEQEPERLRTILFSLAGSRYGVEVAQVREVLEVPPVTPVPNVPGWVLGVANLRGEILSVVDLGAFLGFGPPDWPEGARMLVVRSAEDEVTVGLVVERVEGLGRFEPDGIRRVEVPGQGRLTRYLSGVYQGEDPPVFLVDLAGLLSSKAMRELEPTPA